jgi:peptidoglycan/xylan/chitin deacetylase (PgdA/CDA1 family)
LVYHRINELRSDPWALGVTPRRFAEHLEVLRDCARPIRLEQLSGALLDGSLPDRSVVVTFDDGYADNLYNAKPLLERYDVPATVFVTTGYVGSGREFWWDELDRLLLQPGTLPEALRLESADLGVEIEEVSVPEPDPERLLGCHVELPKPGSRGNAIEVAGWVLGKRSRAVAVELLSGGEVFRRLPLEVPRPDIAAAFPGARGAEESGFRATVGVAGMAEPGLEVRAVLEDQGRVPIGAIRSVTGSGTYHWRLGEAAHYDEQASRRARCWRVWEHAPSSRHLLYRSLWELLRSLSADERQRVSDELLEWAKAEPTGRPTHRPLSFEEVGALAQGELVEVGAHTVTHPALSALPVTSQRDEILGSKARLEEILNRPVKSFSYPYGALSTQTVGAVRAAGFACACSDSPGTVGRSTDRFQLPRVGVQGWDGREFARRLSRWFDHQ